LCISNQFGLRKPKENIVGKEWDLGVSFQEMIMSTSNVCTNCFSSFNDSLASAARVEIDIMR
jgi:protein-arginine kinase activator protein McsA